MRRWLTGDAAQVGRAIMDPLPWAARVERAVAVLDVCRAQVARVVAVDGVVRVGSNPKLWADGHTAFDRVRDLVLAEERRPTDRAYCLLLFVAESAAQTIYNASNPRDPFDDDSPHWVAANSQSFVLAVADDYVGRAVWQALSGCAVSAAEWREAAPFADSHAAQHVGRRADVARANGRTDMLYRIFAVVVILGALWSLYGNGMLCFIVWYSGVSPEMSTRDWSELGIQAAVNLGAIALAWRGLRWRAVPNSRAGDPFTDGVARER